MTLTFADSNSAAAGSMLAWLAAISAATVALVLWTRLRRWRRAAEELARSVDAAAGGSEPAQGTEQWPLPVGTIAVAMRRRERMGREREQWLETRLQEVEAILRSTADSVIALDSQQRVLDLNAAAERLLAIEAEAARGRLLQESTRQSGLNSFVAEAMGAIDPIEGEFAIEGGTPSVVRAVAAPLRDAAGRRLGLLVSLRDVTRLRKLESLRTDFVANVSHELRTPITAIKGYVDTLLQIGAGDPEQVRRFLEIVARNTQRLSSLIEDLLTLASLEQVDAERVELEPERVEAAAIVREVVEQLAPAAEAKRMSIEVAVEPGLVVQVQRVLAEQALMNLVSNAIRYSPEGSPVAVTARARDARRAEFAIRDAGPGIASVHHERIFERFYRVDRARTRTQGGTGLGLAIVKHIAQLHGGSVELESRVGVGSTFRLLLPREAESPPRATTPAA